MSYIHITSEVPCTLSVNGKYTYQLNDIFKKVHIYSDKNFYLSFLPNEKSPNFLPYTTSINNVDNINCIKVPFANNHYDIIFTPQMIQNNLPSVTLLDKKYGDYYLKISNNNFSYLNFSHSTKGVILNKQLPLLNSVTSEIKNNIIIKGTTLNQYYIMIFDSKNNKIIIDDLFDNKEENDKSIKLFKNENNISKHGKVFVYDKKLGSVDSYYVYTDTNPIITKQTELIPVAFLESVKCNDFTLCKNYLHDAFITKEHLKNYFGDIKSIYFNGYTTTYNYTIFSNKYRNFDFAIKDNKITDIEEIKLSY